MWNIPSASMRCYVGWVFITVFLLQEMRSWAWMVGESRACHISKPSSSSGTSSQDKSLFFSQEESSKWKSKWAERSKKHWRNTSSKQLPALQYLSATSPWLLRDDFFSHATNERTQRSRVSVCYTCHVSPPLLGTCHTCIGGQQPRRTRRLEDTWCVGGKYY